MDKICLCVHLYLLYQKNGVALSAVVVLQVDDSIIVGLDEFLRIKDEKAKNTLSKDRKRLGEELTI